MLVTSSKSVLFQICCSQKKPSRSGGMFFCWCAWQGGPNWGLKDYCHPGRGSHQPNGKCVHREVESEGSRRPEHEEAIGYLNSDDEGDKGVLRVIRCHLQAGIMTDGIDTARQEGTPQGSPLSLLLSNMMLSDEADDPIS
jgi:hypothetical protein